MLRDIHKRALQRAAVIVGGNEELRIHLGVTETDFASWPGKRELPKDIFLRLVDIIVKEEVRNVQRYRPTGKALANG